MRRYLRGVPLQGLLTGLAAVLVVVALVEVFVVAPKEATMGDVQRIFYFHVASAWVSFFAFFLVFVAGIAYLRTRRMDWDVLATSAAEVGVVFTSLTLISGSIWAKQAWGTWWEWEPRLVTTLILWLIYVSYLILRESIEERGRRATISAVYGIIGFADVPIVFMSIRWWRTIHPTVASGSGFDMAPGMVPALFLSVAAMTAVFLSLLLLRVSVEGCERRLEEMQQAAGFMSWEGR